MNITIIVFWHGRGAEQYEIKQHLIRTVINRSLFYLMLYLVTSASFLVSGNKYATTDEEEVIGREEEKQSGLKAKFPFFFLKKLIFRERERDINLLLHLFIAFIG